MADKFSGVHWMLATPFHEDESIDSASIGNLVDKAVSSGCQGMVCLGVTGEAARLTDRERYQVAEMVIQRAQGLSVTVGTTAGSTAAAIDRSKEAQELGAAAVMVSPPPMGKPNPDAVFSHYSMLVLSQLGFGNCLRKRLRLLPFFRSVDVGGWQPWDENGMWSGWKGKNETSWND